MRYYTGIGSRNTPKDMLLKMESIGKVLSNDFCLRSGGAEGADLAFEKGCDRARGKKEIYLPWRGFNKSKSKLFNVSSGARQLAEKHHPAFQHLSRAGQLLIARDGYQVLGADLKTPSEFIICWTEDGADGSNIGTSKHTGGTGQAIRIASAYRIPVYNLRFQEFDIQQFQNKIYEAI